MSDPTNPPQPNGDNPYAPSAGTPEPYAPGPSQPYGQAPGASQPYGQAPAPAQPYGQQPYGQAPGQAPYGQQPYGQAPGGVPPYGATPGAPYGQAAPPSSPTNGLAIAALIVGILALLTSFVPILGIIVGVVALVLGFLGLRKAGVLGTGKGMAVTGLVLGGVAVVVSVLVTVFVGTFLNRAQDDLRDLDQQIQDAQEQLEGVEGGDETASDPLAFGETYTWEDGLAVTIGRPEPFEPSEWVADASSATDFVVVEVTVANGTSEEFDPILARAEVQSGSAEAEPVYDPENDIGFGPTSTLLPGREVTWKVAFAVADPDDVLVQLSPSWEYGTAYWGE